MMDKVFSPKRGFLVIFLSIVFYSIIVFYSDFSEFSNEFPKVNLYYLPLIAVALFFSLFLKSIRLKNLLKQVGLNIKLKDSFVIFVASQTFLLSPGGVGSVVKSHFLKSKYGYPVSKTLSVVIVERIYDLLAILSLLVFSISFTYFDEFIFPTVALGLATLVMWIILKNKKLFFSFSKFLKRFKRFQTISDKILDSHNDILKLTSKKSALIFWPYSILCWIADAVIFFLCFLSFDLPFNILESTAISYTSLLFGYLSFIPGGLGITEVSMIGILVENNIEVSLASSAVLYLRLCTIWAAAFLGILTTKKALAEKNQ